MAAGVSTTEPGSPEVDHRKGNLLSLISFLRLICDHGEQLLPRPAVDAWKARDGTSINWQMMQSCRKRCCNCGTDIEEADFLASNGHGPRCQHWICTACALQIEKRRAYAQDVQHRPVLGMIQAFPALQIPAYLLRPRLKRYYRISIPNRRWRSARGQTLTTESETQVILDTIKSNMKT
jgi:hypothetical protein